VIESILNFSTMRCRLQFFIAKTPKTWTFPYMLKVFRVNLSTLELLLMRDKKLRLFLKDLEDLLWFQLIIRLRIKNRNMRELNLEVCCFWY
jgi:hypothetical protein